MLARVQVDAQVGEAARHAVKRSLAELAAALHGSRRLEVRHACALYCKESLHDKYRIHCAKCNVNLDCVSNCFFCSRGLSESTVRRHLLKLAARLQVVPLLRVELFLDRSNRIELRPTAHDLAAAIDGLAQDIVSAIRAVPRVATQLTASQLAVRSGAPVISQTLSRD